MSILIILRGCAVSCGAHSAANDAFDTLEVTRPVRDARPFDVDILIDLRFEPARFKVSEELRYARTHASASAVCLRRG